MMSFNSSKNAEWKAIVQTFYNKMQNQENATKDVAKNLSVVDSILGETTNSDSSPTTQIAEGFEPIVITPPRFFSDNEQGGYVTASEFIEHIRSLNENERAAFNALLELMADEQRIDSPNYVKLHKGKPVMFCTNKQQFGERQFMVYTVGDMKTFVGLYQMGLLKCKLNLEDLCREAVRLVSEDIEIND